MPRDFSKMAVLPPDKPLPRDYHRLRRKPVKACIDCGMTYPNTRDHFAVGSAGRLMKTCVRCYKPPPMKLAGGTPCPLCRMSTRLVPDNQAPPVEGKPVPMICRKCLSAMNMVASSRNDDAVARWIRYFQWRWSGLPDRKAPG